MRHRQTPEIEHERRHATWIYHVARLRIPLYFLLWRSFTSSENTLSRTQPGTHSRSRPLPKYRDHCPIPTGLRLPFPTLAVQPFDRLTVGGRDEARPSHRLTVKLPNHKGGYVKERASRTRAGRPRPDNVADWRHDAANQTTRILCHICGGAVKSKWKMENGKWRIVQAGRKQERRPTGGGGLVMHRAEILLETDWLAVFL